MKKILLSLGTLVVVGAVVWGATAAFYNDTETSSGNIFVAGSIDLKVDHLAQTYNGDDCETCSLTLYSGDGGAQVVGGTNTVLTTFPFPAVLVTPTSITTQYWTTHGTADWIWASPATLVGDDGTLGDVTYTFEHEFTWWGAAVDVNLLMDVAGDNQYQVLLNGTPIATGVGGAQYTTLDPVSEALFLAQVQPGPNTLTFVVTNLVNTPAQNNTPLNNPGGLLYYLTVTRDPEDCDANSEFQLACQLWTETDLDGSQTFFNFGDIKPSDWGTNLISLHVSSNDAYACLFPNNIVDAENVRIEPEATAGDPTDGTVADGELSQFVKVFAWADDGDGVYEGEQVLVTENTPFNLVPSVIAAMDLSANDTDYIGLSWCVGTQTLVGDVIGCSGSAVGIDQAQTDSVSAALTAYAVQQRNNDNFTCAQAYDELFPSEPL
ncbi:MAG: hypothetical protein A2431_01240 [Candidatus Zambryskibacteria bacterium RIFOXYC1_FULL_39_10]|uniref:Uncharacterized protein n=1 Tax=Candidatus Zambryskibacteria bacterium RIFOXYC1_FULL_39_10 TaxID=1802779 RepID=A0A1G2V2L7_9BACT|nr:MAG: hypothetical protein A2431_01240 [Candidatus Zambryskibacteria bacterium RIFOXYC1_FULL_39_10]OHB16923.1 MAG: hypothetical protein A2605_00450 [Candidatus Zambryskibacteria bacterium RIFOXYD1_FULL_39_35]